MVSDQNADSFVLEMADHLFDIGNCKGIDVGKRFI